MRDFSNLRSEATNVKFLASDEVPEREVGCSVYNVGSVAPNVGSMEVCFAPQRREGVSGPASDFRHVTLRN